MSDVEFTSATTHDAQQHAASLHAWQQQYEQITPGRFEGRIEDLWLGPVQLFREFTSQAVLQSGSPPPDSFTIAVTAGAGDGAWFCGHRLQRQRTIAVGSGAEFEFVTSPGMELLAVCIAAAQLEQHTARIEGGGTTALALPRVCVLDGEARSPLELQELLGSAMQLAREHPALLAQPALRRTLSQSLADLVLDCLRLDRWRTAPPLGATARRRVVQQARDYMQAHAEEAITVPDLCAATGISRRSLQYAFDDVLQVSPVTYLRMMRLNRVRRDLLSGGAGSVGDIAARWGFWHLSRFAADYKAMFGELPSATRAQAGAARPG